MRPEPWPYPFWIAHRGAGKLAPENTLAAFRLGAQHGYTMFECDTKLSADGVLFLLHDTTLERTTSTTGRAADLSWSELSRVDAGSKHSRQYAGEPPATLESLARFCLANSYFLNIEIKPTPGAEAATGEAVAELAERMWADAPVPPLLSSFRPDALQAAQQRAPQLPRVLLLETLWDGWERAAQELDCCAISCDYPLWDAQLIEQVQAVGMRALSYTGNDEWMAEYLMKLGTDGIITDRIDRFSPSRRQTR